jgi:NDP-sugar pyrophosphorylase family protein
VLLLRSQLTEPFIMMNGDILTTLNFRHVYEAAATGDAELTVVTKEVVTPFNFGKVTSDGPYIRSIEEKPDLRLEILAGIYVLRPAVLDLIPPDQYFGIDLLIKAMLAKQMRVRRHFMKDYWLDIGQVAEYEIAQTAYTEHFDHFKTRK